VVEMDQVPVCLDFFVDPDYQRSGIGKVLFDFMLEVSRTRCMVKFDVPVVLKSYANPMKYIDSTTGSITKC
jgi:GNAT superfamily N-acetyltransferase